MKRFIASIIIILSLSVTASAENYSGYRELALSESDIELAARAVRAAAGEENYLVKACVTSMIFNRLRDPAMPDSMEEVIFENGVFLTAAREEIEKEVPPDELEEYTVLARIVYEYGIDPACGALFCFEEGDDVPRRFVITLSVDGKVFAKRRFT